MPTPEFNLKQPDRRNFLASLASGAAALGLATIAPVLQLQANEIHSLPLHPEDPDTWFNQIKGKHKAVFDVPHPHEVFPFAWPKVFLLSNESTGTRANDCSVVVVLRHNAIPYAFEDKLWAKYAFGKFFKADDPLTKTPSVRNPFWKPKAGDFTIPGIGNVEIGINELQDNGVMFCVCGTAITVQSTVMAEKMKMKADDLKNEWMSGLLPGIQVVPSGIWALGRAQEHGCTYIFAG